VEHEGVEHDPYPRPVLAELAALSDRAVAAELNRRKIATPSGGLWHGQSEARLGLICRDDNGSPMADTISGTYSVSVGSSGYGGNALRFQPRRGPRAGRDKPVLPRVQTDLGTGGSRCSCSVGRP
jgi:hypothetical protein